MANVRTCVACGKRHNDYSPYFCNLCHYARVLFSEWGSGRSRAGIMVAVAKRAGHLLPASRLHCSDCGAAACDYDHRDYNDPLNVEPVCRGCNLRRGYATPLSWCFERFTDWATGRVIPLIGNRSVGQRMRENHFTGPGGTAVRMLRVRDLRAALGAPDVPTELEQKAA